MPNALIHETSPYLRQHAHNPVDWVAWSESAFARARSEDKLVFLSVGYSTCHWCHVMERESFENEEVAAVMNRHFVNVKVDREERPDVDATFMAYVQAATGHGGWPMSVWLTPTGEPVAGGTYFPPHDRGGRAGFTRICNELARLWRDDRGRLCESANDAVTHLRAATAPRPPAEPPPHIFDDFVESCGRMFDDAHGGFGGAPKFPRPVVAATLLRMAERFAASPHQAARCRNMAFATLRAMANGGIRDHLGGGFHRYSVDRRWHVPHYEKMLYDQAQLASVYLDAWQAGGGEEMRTTAEQTLQYVITELRDPCGAFHAAEDADSFEHEGDREKLEGAFWTWRDRELVELLDQRQAAWFRAAYGVSETGNAAPDSDPHGELAGRNTLWRACSDAELAVRFGTNAAEVAAVLHTAREALLAARSRRPRPHRDDKVVSAWNGLLLASLAKAARILGRSDFAAAANDLCAFLRGRMWNGTRLARSWRDGTAGGHGFAADYAAVIHGLLEWHGVNGDPATLRFAAELQDAMEKNCRIAGRTGYVMCTRIDDHALWEIEDDHDGAEPAPNHLAADNLQRLAVLVDRPDRQSRAEELLRAAAGTAAPHPFAAPVWLAALDLRERGVIKIDVRGEPPPDLAHALRATWIPRAVWTRGQGNGEVIVCQGQTCLPPIRSAAAWQEIFPA